MAYRFEHLYAGHPAYAGKVKWIVHTDKSTPPQYGPTHWPTHEGGYELGPELVLDLLVGGTFTLHTPFYGTKPRRAEILLVYRDWDKVTLLGRATLDPERWAEWVSKLATAHADKLHAEVRARNRQDNPAVWRHIARPRTGIVPPFRPLRPGDEEILEDEAREELEAILDEEARSDAEAELAAEERHQIEAEEEDDNWLEDFEEENFDDDSGLRCCECGDRLSVEEEDLGRHFSCWVECSHT
jgi:hypothetical protein